MCIVDLVGTRLAKLARESIRSLLELLLAGCFSFILFECAAITNKRHHGWVLQNGIFKKQVFPRLALVTEWTVCNI